MRWSRRRFASRLPHSFCEECGKNSYPSDIVAISAALRSSTNSGTPLRTYRCPRKNGWHLTSRTGRSLDGDRAP